MLQTRDILKIARLLRIFADKNAIYLIFYKKKQQQPPISVLNYDIKKRDNMSEKVTTHPPRENLACVFLCPLLSLVYTRLNRTQPNMKSWCAVVPLF